MKIAVIGTGISGLTAAYGLHKQHDITVFESANRIGGHTATIDVEYGGKQYAIDTGFIVYNDWTYPEFIQLMNELGVRSRPTDMSFSVSCDSSDLEYGGSNLNTLFAQRKNLLKPRFWWMLKDILRFNRQSCFDFATGNIDPAMSLGNYLSENNYGDTFINQYLIPMGSAIWSSSCKDVLNFSAYFFIRFFKNHGLLSINDRPQWRVIEGGSRAYLEPLIQGFKHKIRTGVEIKSVCRSEHSVSIDSGGGEAEYFDQVIFACHSDEALALLGDVSDLEQSILGAIPYQVNDVVLHTDTRLLPANRRAWSSWNYWLRSTDQDTAVVTYNMNILQNLQADATFCVTLNATESINPDTVIGQYRYSHPVFSRESIAAVARWPEINGVNRTWFAGAYWGNGFHEDGVVSGKRIARQLINAAECPEMALINNHSDTIRVGTHYA